MKNPITNAKSATAASPTTITVIGFITARMEDPASDLAEEDSTMTAAGETATTKLTVDIENPTMVIIRVTLLCNATFQIFKTSDNPIIKIDF